MATEKETTAPIPSVAPDGEQPSALARTDSITDPETAHKQFGKIQIMTMPELMETRFRVRPAVIDGLLPAGTYLLAGAPKIGKSFLVLQMAYQVSMGAPFLGFSSRQGTVLYLALEDTCERLQKRLAQMTEQDSEHLILSVFSETLDEGLTERLSDFWSEHTDTVLIIIDTLQRVRGRTPDNGSYAADYDTLARLKEFSDTYGVTVLVVHHTRKEGAEDVFNMISGTNGLMGAADGALLDHKAVCAGYGRAYEMLCKAAGIQVIYVASEEMNHGWNAVRLGGTTYYIDCTFDDPIPDRGEYVSDQYFMLTGDELAQTHTWNEAFYEQLLDSLEQGGK